MAPPVEKMTEEVSSLSDENIIYPIIALTIVMLRLGCGVSTLRHKNEICVFTKLQTSKESANLKNDLNFTF